MITRENIEARVRKLVEQQLGFAGLAAGDCKLTEESTLEEFDFDSLDQVELVMSLEEEFSEEVSNVDAFAIGLDERFGQMAPQSAGKITYRDVLDFIEQVIRKESR